MRKVIPALFVCVMFLALGAVKVSADGMILPELLTAEYLVVRYHHVEVTIQDNLAVTRVEQEFYNPNDFHVNGRYLFPIPPDAVVSSFHAVLDGQDQTILHQDRATTNTFLFNMVTDRQDASLLQYMDWESFAFDLSLPPGGSRQMTLEYQEVLAPVGGMYQYRYILSTERYSSQPLEEASIRVDLDSSMGLSTIYSSSHDVDIEELGNGRAQVVWEAENIHPYEDFDLFFAPSEGGFGGGLLTGERGGIDHFLFMFSPDMTAVEQAPISKDIVFVIDRSGSMAGEKLIQAQNALTYILRHLNENDRFSVVGFNDRISPLSWNLQNVSNQNVTNARLFVNEMFADGSTDIEAAVQTGLEIFTQSETRSGASKMIVFLTDGLPTAGVVDDAVITRLVTQTNEELEARLHVFGVGYDVNTHLLDALANENGGSVTYVQPGDDLELAMVDFYDRVSQPVLTDIEIEFEGITVSDLFPQNIPDMFQGSSLMLTGRFSASAPMVTVRVRGKMADQARQFEYHFELDKNGKNDFVPRLWATRQIGLLLDLVRVEGESAQIVEEVRELGLAYGLVTPYTSFIITPQEWGAASLSNMMLYDDLTQLNQVSGATTIQARVQNQFYQQADQASLATGANVINSGQNSLAQVEDLNVDLALLADYDIRTDVLTPEWFENIISVDRYIEFGSAEYYQLTQDPEIRTYLQSGANVIFEHDGEVISVQTTKDGVSYHPKPYSPSFLEKLLEAFLSWLKGDW
jgi:Ca-activated chloride channel family protein